MIKIIIDHLTNPKEGNRYKLYLPREFGETVFNNKVGEFIVTQFADHVNEWFDKWERPINYSTDHITKEAKYFGCKGKGIRRLTLMADEAKVKTALETLNKQLGEHQ